jgi:hypothetical protein
VSLVTQLQRRQFRSRPHPHCWRPRGERPYSRALRSARSPGNTTSPRCNAMSSAPCAVHGPIMDIAVSAAMIAVDDLSQASPTETLAARPIVDGGEQRPAVLVNRSCVVALADRTARET